MATTCGFKDCGRKRHALGWCTAHYSQYTRNVPMLPIRSRRAPGEAKRSRRDVWLWGTYRLTVEQYDALAANGCTLCGSFEDLVVDHDHDCCSGKRSCGACVRGVLCRVHNVWLGMVGDDPTFLDAASEYLRKGLS